MTRAVVLACLTLGVAAATADPIYRSARASTLDATAREYHEINFTFGTDEKSADVQIAAVDPDVASRGELVIWLMGPNRELFDRLTANGFHVVQPHYARGWFSKLCRDEPVGPTCRGNVRLEAATGEDFSDRLDLQPQDGMTARTATLLAWLAKEAWEDGWGQFLNDDGSLHFEKVVLAGASHGSTTAARFAKHQAVARVVMFCGPRDQYQSWQALLSATPAHRYFGFSHTLDGGWTADHYCRSWQMLGLPKFGPIVDVDVTPPPFGSTRRLVTSFDVGGDAGRAHSGVTPGSRASRTEEGGYAHEAVWRYLFMHPVDEVGAPVPSEADCELDQRQ